MQFDHAGVATDDADGLAALYETAFDAPVAHEETFDDLGVDLIDESPRPGAWGHDVAFCHPKSTGGVLVEFVEH